jgi:hypothetical protein
MKKVLLMMILIWGIFLGCGPTTGDKGANEDGIRAFRDDTTMQAHPSTDTAMGEHRVDLSKRDSSK